MIIPVLLTICVLRLLYLGDITFNNVFYPLMFVYFGFQMVKLNQFTEQQIRDIVKKIANASCKSSCNEKDLQEESEESKSEEEKLQNNDKNSTTVNINDLVSDSLKYTSDDAVFDAMQKIQNIMVSNENKSTDKDPYVEFMKQHHEFDEASILQQKLDTENLTPE